MSAARRTCDIAFVKDDGEEPRSRTKDWLLAVVGIGVAIADVVLAMPWLRVEGHLGGLGLAAGTVFLLGALFAAGGVAAALRGRGWAWAFVALAAVITIAWWSFLGD